MIAASPASVVLSCAVTRVLASNTNALRDIGYILVVVGEVKDGDQGVMPPLYLDGTSSCFKPHATGIQ